MKELFVNDLGSSIPKKFTGIVRSLEKTSWHYFKDGKRHKTDGPASYFSGDKVYEYRLEGIKYTKQEFLARQTTLGRLLYKNVDGI